MLRTNKDKKRSKSTRWMSNETFLSCLQFSACFANTGWAKYSSLYFLNNGISASELGFMATFSSMGKLIGYPTWGILTDLILTSNHDTNNALKFKLMFTSLLFFSNLSVWVFYWPSTHQLIFNSFWIMIIFRCIRSWLNSIWNLVDTVTMKLLTDKANYGLHRLYASIAWGVGCCISGYLIDIYSMDAIFYYGAVVNMFTMLLVLVFMPHIPTTAETLKMVTDPKQSDSLLLAERHGLDHDEHRYNLKSSRAKPRKSLFLLFRIIYAMRRDREFMKSLLIIQVYFICMQIIERIIFVEMDQEFHLKRVNIGIVTGFSVIPEIPFFYYSKSIINRFQNNNNKLILLCHLALLLRIFCYIFVSPSLQSEQWMIFTICMIQLLHGVTFSLMWAVCRGYLHKIGVNHSTMQLDIGGSIQSVLGMIVVLSNGIGGFLWLWVYDHYPPKMTYLFGCVALIPSIGIVALNTNTKNVNLFNVSSGLIPA